MLVVEDLQPPVLSHPKIPLFYSLALLSLEAGMGGFLLQGLRGKGGSTSTGIASSPRMSHMGKPTTAARLLGLHQHLPRWETLPVRGSPLSPLPALPPGVPSYLRRWDPGCLCHPTQPGSPEMELRAGAALS